MEKTIKITGRMTPEYEKILTKEAQEFLVNLHQHFNEERKQLLEHRKFIEKKIENGWNPDFLEETKEIREDLSWKVAPLPHDLQKRWVEITGPTDKKMVINALNSGADVFMADFEDANSPIWENMIEGQVNLHEAVNHTLRFTSKEGKEYTLSSKIAVLMVRPRGWHLEETHFQINGQNISGSLFDFGLFLFHNAKILFGKGGGAYFYLPKLENHKEARLWAKVFAFSEQYLNLTAGSIKATVLLETILAAFEMDEILYELRDYSAGLNAGRWDYIFSAIKKFKNRSDAIFPDRSQITMTVPFMRSYTQLLVQTCHKRGAHAIGGMAAFIPSRKDPAINEVALKKVEEDKLREANAGFDGTWVAHPDLVPLARSIFEDVLKGANHQRSRLSDVLISANDLLNFKIPGGTITEDGVKSNVSVALQYIYSWKKGVGAVGINNLMEDTATAEISRAQLWQWLHHNIQTKEGYPITPTYYKKITDREIEQLSAKGFNLNELHHAKRLLDTLVEKKEFIDFLTLVQE